MFNEYGIKVRASKYLKKKSLETMAHTRKKDYIEPLSTPFFEPFEFKAWSFWREGII